MQKPNKISSLRAVGTFLRVKSCAQMVFNVLNRAYRTPLEEAEAATMPLAGGILQHGYQCGLVWGGAFGAGARALKLFGTGPKGETAALAASIEIVSSFVSQNRHLDCLELTEENGPPPKRSRIAPRQRGGLGCFRMAARYAPKALDAIETALSDAPIAASEPPISCAAVMAKRLGMSDEHSVIAAGLAGGIGLSGGACGALGVAIWHLGLAHNAGAEKKIDFQDPKGLAMIEHFLEGTDYELECSAIAGRRFENIAEHSSYLKQGGCAHVFERLSGTPKV